VLACSFFRGYSQLNPPHSASGNPAAHAFWDNRERNEPKPSLILKRAHRNGANCTDLKANDLWSSGGIVKVWIEKKKKEAMEAGKVGWVMLWLLGVPIPVLLILFLLRGCT